MADLFRLAKTSDLIRVWLRGSIADVHEPWTHSAFMRGMRLIMSNTHLRGRSHLRYVAFVVTPIGRIKTLCSSSTVKPRLAMNAMMVFSVICSGSKPIVAIPCG
jgi:hypothetical protein